MAGPEGVAWEAMFGMGQVHDGCACLLHVPMAPSGISSRC